MTTWTGSVSTVSAGMTTGLSAALATYRDPLKALTEARSTWTPTYTGINAIGNATVTARYLQANKLVIGYVRIVMGSTTTYSAATLSVSVPVTPRDDNMIVGSAIGFDTGSSVRIVAQTLLSSGTFIFLGSTSNSVWTNLIPYTWANTDELRLEFCYEAA